MASGVLSPAHISPGGVAIFEREYIEAKARARNEFRGVLPRLKAAYGMAPPRMVDIEDEQKVLPLDGLSRG